MVARNGDRTLGALTAMVVAAIAAVSLWALGFQLEDALGLHFTAPMPPFALLVVLAGTAVGWLLEPVVLESSRPRLLALVIVAAVLAEVIGAFEVAAMAFAAPLMTQPFDLSRTVAFLFAMIVMPMFGSVMFAPVVLPISTAAAAAWIVVLRVLGRADGQIAATYP